MALFRCGSGGAAKPNVKTMSNVGAAAVTVTLDKSSSEIDFISVATNTGVYLLAVNGNTLTLDSYDGLDYWAQYYSASINGNQFSLSQTVSGSMTVGLTY